MEEDTQWIAFADVTKAYDNVDLDTLDRIIVSMNPPEDVLLEWKDELRDLKMLNMNVSGVEIKRSNGLPQGSELAPALFNIYTTYILNHLQGLHDTEIKVFADNWVLCFHGSRQSFEDMIHLINIQLSEYSLQFTSDEIEIQQIDSICDKPVDKEGKAIIQQFGKKVKFLGVYWIFYEHRCFVDFNDCTFNFPKFKKVPGYYAIKLIKKFLVPKFRYYYDYLKCLNSSEAQKYWEWFKSNLRKYAMTWMNLINLPYEACEQWINPNHSNKIFRSHLTPWFAKNKDIIEKNLKPNQIQMLNKLKELSEYVLQTNIHIGIYQTTNFLFKNRKAEDYFFKNESNQNERQCRRTWNILDIMYQAIILEKRFSTLIFQEQEKFMAKTTRKRFFRFL